MNLMVSMGVSLVVPSITRIASICTLSSFSRFVCAIGLTGIFMLNNMKTTENQSKNQERAVGRTGRNLYTYRHE